EVPDFERAGDADSNNTYDLGTVIITNVDGGMIDFPLSVRTLNVPSMVTLRTNVVNVTLDIYNSNVIENLIEFVDFDALMTTSAMAGNLAYNYELAGADAIYFKTVLNTLKTAGDFGFRSIYENGGVYNFQVNYIPDENGTFETLYVTVTIAEPQWREIIPSAAWAERNHFESVVLSNNDILILGGSLGNGNLANDIWRSSDGGSNWEEITASAPWRPDYDLRAVGLLDNELLVTSDFVIPNGGKQLGNDIWISDRNFNWNNINDSAPWSNYNTTYELVLLKNNDILFILNKGNYSLSVANEINQNFEVWLSSDKGISWSLIKEGGDYSGNVSKIALQVVVLTNNDILHIRSYLANKDGFVDTLLSSDAGTNWTLINSSTDERFRTSFEVVVLPNNDILSMGGYVYGTFSAINDVWRSRDGGRNWTDITPADHWSPRFHFKAVFLPNKGTLVMGGAGAIGGVYNKNDVWLREEYNRHYY
nr:glycoside hydrolase [Gammaproteobacteria bacterium]